jgi:hypothetical protein
MVTLREDIFFNRLLKYCSRVMKSVLFCRSTADARTKYQ